ncbi:hypothetical protein QNJ39_02445 [Macrococcus caseolyticus]|uniref:hypothetical protein n=1 Tax=Macrococcoides caseolyticum TaxID=69966 RepID=UPI0024BD5A10|nr:hypothetical protein [Macrococcus caseolyticus]MDJ1090479.1 hypothetical protein [Macrococcus caseolyticus]MDJ1153248.1 hypothetical protein [Macrococcus caseolyticus]
MIGNAFLLVITFEIEKRLSPDSYFALSEFFVSGIDSRKVIKRLSIIASYNLFLLLIYNNFFLKEVSISISILSSLIGVILIVYPAFKDKDKLTREFNIRKKIDYLYISFIFVTLTISIFVSIFVILCYEKFNVSIIWQESKVSVILYFLLSIPGMILNPFLTTKKLKLSVDKYIEQEDEKRKKRIEADEKEWEFDNQVLNKKSLIKRIIDKFIRIGNKIKDI